MWYYLVVISAALSTMGKLAATLPPEYRTKYQDLSEIKQDIENLTTANFNFMITHDIQHEDIIAPINYYSPKQSQSPLLSTAPQQFINQESLPQEYLLISSTNKPILSRIHRQSIPKTQPKILHFNYANNRPNYSPAINFGVTPTSGGYTAVRSKELQSPKTSHGLEKSAKLEDKEDVKILEKKMDEFFEENNKGFQENEDSSRSYGEDEGSKKSYENGGQFDKSIIEAFGVGKSAASSEKDKFDKHKSHKGFHDEYQKDERKKLDSFYDNNHEEGEWVIFGKQNAHHGKSGGGKEGSTWSKEGQTQQDHKKKEQRKETQKDTKGSEIFAKKGGDEHEHSTESTYSKKSNKS